MKRSLKLFTICLATLLILFLQNTAGFADQSVLKEGMSGDGVLNLQQKLRDLGYYQGTPDGVFGPGTRSAVASFQSANNLTADGIAGVGTLEALRLSGSNGGVLKEGMTGDSVLKLQQKLRDLGYYQGTPDGSFGPGTRSAVASFQSANNLTVDGIAGAGTLEALRVLSSNNGEQSALKEGMSGDSVLKLQQKLRDLGYYQGTPDGSFGPGTHSAVASFQSANNLTVDGIAGAGTLAALRQGGTVASAGNTAAGGEPAALKQGMSGDNVLKLQTKLSELGYYQGTPDGAFGPGTRSAVANFQYDNKLTVDGVAGEKTLLALQSANPQVALANRGQAIDRDTQAIVAFARQYLGVPYAWAGQGPSGFDCSGFTYYVFDYFNINLPRTADGQYSAGSKVSKLQPGDLVFFSTYEPGPSHVGIYIGDNQFIHSSSGAGVVTITSLSDSYYKARYLGARRVIG
ncbi:D-gamma-glutamyl-meso-diaminopimelic acid endopeptidase CwlS precursor [Pelotomaculum sp. FP]|uniref:C40 family peptidase n=1 Tax=Pelotomaculum sp. FP TaxID=261474 RepID=UPI0010656AD8|nr:peptidoglycan-binding protein [Pelotomaculum sp. FP]TEB17316.1 D-gamma-glutamyl-meso-diaminopimelic acid endopeptidase CwlS precursor [Pelotomaculum sp. FP]